MTCSCRRYVALLSDILRHFSPSFFKMRRPSSTKTYHPLLLNHPCLFRHSRCVPQVDLLPADPAGLVHFGNMALRCLQLHQYTHLRPTPSFSPPSSGGNQSMYISTAAFAHHLFTSAARLSGHSGAFHSLGVLYKLYPTLVTTATGTQYPIYS